MSQDSIKVIFFDAAGTLFNVQGSVADVYLRYAHKYGVEPKPETQKAITVAFQKAFSEAPSPVFAVRQPEQLKQCERLWWFDVVHAVFYRVGMFDGFDEFFEEVFEAFGRGDHWFVYPDVFPALEILKGKGYELGVISNFDTRLFGILRELGLYDYLDSITISSLAGAAKPARQIFQFALDQHAMDPEEALHVGDSVQEDLEGAMAAGLGSFLVIRNGKYSQEFNTIRTLEDLPLNLSRLT